MARKRKRARPLGVVVVDRVGFRKGLRAMTFLLDWGAFIEAQGEPPESIDEMVEVLGGSRATFFREQAVFREAFPDEEDPTRIWEAIRNQVDDPKSEASKLIVGGLVVADV